MKLILKISVLFLFTPSFVKAQFTYSQNVEKAQNAILDLNFEQYDSIKSRRNKAEEGMFYWLDGYKSFVGLKTTSQSVNIDSVKNNILLQIQKVENLQSTDPLSYYCSADLHLFVSYISFEQNQTFTTIQHYLKAKSLINKYRDSDTGFFAEKHELIEHLIDYLLHQQLGIKTDDVQEQHKEFISLIGSAQKSESVVYKREVKLLGVLLAGFEFEGSEELVINGLGVDENFAANGPLESLAGVLMTRNACDYKAMDTMLLNAEAFKYTQQLNQLNFWLGNSYLNKLNDSCLVFFNRFISKQNSGVGVPYVDFKLAMYWFVNHRNNIADSLVNQVKLAAELNLNADKQALYEVKHFTYWKPELVRSRLLFDGGNYQEALAALLTAKGKVENYNNYQKLEYSYRLARIYDRLGNIEFATRFYQMAINSKLDQEFYYPAYAAYYLGKMYVDKGFKDEAARYFEICLQLDSPVYKTSIHAQARNKLRLTY